MGGCLFASASTHPANHPINISDYRFRHTYLTNLDWITATLSIQLPSLTVMMVWWRWWWLCYPFHGSNQLWMVQSGRTKGSCRPAVDCGTTSRTELSVSTSNVMPRQFQYTMVGESAPWSRTNTRALLYLAPGVALPAGRGSGKSTKPNPAWPREFPLLNSFAKM